MSWLVAPFLVVEAMAAVVRSCGSSVSNTLGAVDHPDYRAFYAGRDALDFERWSLDAWTSSRSEHIRSSGDFRGWG